MGPKFVLLVVVDTDAGPDEVQLINDLMANYTALERPSEITKEPLDVYLKITLRSIIDLVCSKTRIIASRPIGKVFGVLQAHLPLVLDAGTVLLSVPLLICTGFVYCH